MTLTLAFISNALLSQTQDFKIQHLQVDVPGAGLTLTAPSNFSAVADLSKSFIIIDNNRRNGAGSSVDATNVDARGISCSVYFSSTSGIVFSRGTGATLSTRVNITIVEYIGAPGGANEFVVRHRSAVSPTNTTSPQNLTMNSTPQDIDKCIPFYSLQTEDTTNGSAANTLMLYCSGTNSLNYHRGGGTDTVTGRVEVVEFTGSNWSVGHGDSGNTGSDTGIMTLNTSSTGSGGDIFDVVSYNNAFIWHTYKGDSNSSTNEGIADHYPIYKPQGTTQVAWSFHLDHIGVSERHFVHVLKNPFMNVSRFSNNANTAGESTINITSAGLTSINQALIMGSSVSSGGGKAYGRGWRNYYLKSTTSAAHWSHRSGNQIAHEIQIIDLNNLVTAALPKIKVTGNGFNILNGDTTVSPFNNTNYGSVNVGSVVTRTFNIQNTGAGSLTVSSLTLSNNTDFTVTLQPDVTILSGTNSNFSIRYQTLSLGLKTTTVTINNNDSDENPYTFVINANSDENFFDSDGDGVYDNVDIDDDNDGISDVDEELACRKSSTASSVDYKYLNETFGTGERTTINTTYPATTSYTFEDGTDGGDGVELNEGKYTVSSSAQVASWASNSWYLGADHTTNDINGRMAIFNASNDPGVFYTASIKGALPNIPISYSFWVLNLDRTDAPNINSRIRPNIKVEFRDENNNLLTTITTGDIPPTRASNPAGDWYNFSANLTFNVSELNVYFINNNPGGLGNDLAIDDIEIKQSLCDTDGDGVADVFDLDSDNDGIPDVVEAGLGALSEGKATLTYTSGWIDANGNGMDDRAEGHVAIDSDGDGTPNYLDLDSDNDSIFDVDESGAGNLANSSFQNGDGDIDGDGVGDGPDTDFVRKKDVNSDGVLEYFADGILDVYDFYNGATFASAFGNENQGIGNTYFVKDTDGDGIPDYMDVMSDGLTFDISHTLYANLDTDNDGKIDGNTDTDGDGILDLMDTNNSVFGSPRDLNGKLHLYFDGRNDYAQDVSVMNGWGEASMMTWIKLDPTSSGRLRIMGQNQFYLEILANRRLQVNAKGTRLSSSALATNRWIHVATTYSSSNRILRLYVNGALVATSAVNGKLPIDISPLTLGKSSSANVNYFKGFLDEVRIFDKSLSANEIQKMVYQEIERNRNSVRGAIIPRDITDFVSATNNITLDWSSLKRYYRMDTYKGDIIDDLTTESFDINSGMRLYNSKTINYQNAPLPFVAEISGDLNTSVSVLEDGINGADVLLYDWSIVHVKGKAVNFTGNQKHLGLIIDEFDVSSSPIEYNVLNDSELNVSWYLKLDGIIKLHGESQLIQGEDSQLDVDSKGKLEKNQQGTADKFTYNYWSSPVGVRNMSSNNNEYRVKDILKDGDNNINWLTSGYNGTNTTPIGIADYWVWKFANLPDNSYSSWQHVRSTGRMKAGEGFTMKGPGTGSILTDQNYLFSGKPNNGDIFLTLNAGNDYLVGNPYPSAIDGRQFILDNGAIIAGNGSTTGTLYFWEHWGGGSHNLADYQGGYSTYNLSGGTPSASIGSSDPLVGSGGIPTKIPGRYIPVGQGFFVVAEGLGGTIKFKNSQRIFEKEGTDSSVFIRNSEHNTTTIYNRDGADTRMKLRIGFNSINTIHRQILLTVDMEATQGVDWGYDAAYIDTQMDDMYWMIADEKFNIQGTNEITASSVMPLGLHLRNGGETKITIDHLENVPDDLEIFVHDVLLNIYHNLRISDFVFTLPSGTYLDRFEITFQEGTALSIEENGQTDLEIYYANTTKDLVLLNPNSLEIKSIEIFNILGQSIYTIKNVENTSYSEYKVKNLSVGTYIVKLKTVNGETSKKVLVK